MKPRTKQLIDRAHVFATAQEQMAANSKEDSEHWHHVVFADLLREMASELQELTSLITPQE